MRGGEAYWIFSKGASQFQGPIAVKLGGGNRLAFGSSANGLSVELSNAGDRTTQFFVEQLPAGNALPLHYEFRDLKTLATSYPTLPSVMVLPPLAPTAKTSLRLFVRREDQAGSGQSALLKISDGEGAVRWISASCSSSGSN
jgi:hypothetical protein